jgi:hypothetical protein
MIVHKHAHQDCFIEVWDDDRMKHHDKLATQRISVIRLVNESGREWPLVLEEAMADQPVHPRLKLRTVWRPFRVHVESECKTKNGVVGVLLVVLDKLDGMMMETKPPLYGITITHFDETGQDEEFGSTGDVAAAEVNPSTDENDKDKKKENAPAEVALMTSYRKLVKSSDKGNVKFELLIGKKKQGEFGIDIAEIKSMPMHRKNFDVAVKGNIRIKGFAQLLILGDPMPYLKTEWVYEEKPVQGDESADR